jgi:hypothetical protein
MSDHVAPLSPEEEAALRAETGRQLPKMEAFRLLGGPHGGEQWVNQARLLATLDAVRAERDALRSELAARPPFDEDRR